LIPPTRPVTRTPTWRSFDLVGVDPKDRDKEESKEREREDPHRDLAGVLHDVSNALTVLLGWLGEARAPGASAEEMTYALGIVEQRARIARDLARHAIGGPRIDEQREAGAIAAEVVAALRVEAQKTGTRVVLRGEAET